MRMISTLIQGMRQEFDVDSKDNFDPGVTVRHMHAATAVPDRGQFPRAAPRADRQLVYIETYSSALPSSSSLFSLVSSISAIYRAPFTFVE
jgi:hypothetical protein